MSKGYLKESVMDLIFRMEGLLRLPQCYKTFSTYGQGVNDKPVSGHKRGVHKYSLHENSSEIDQKKTK